LVVTKNWTIRQLDVNNVFLHEELQEDIYMAQPPGFQDPNYPTHVCHLHKVIYGLKQSPRMWYHKLKQTLLAIGFITSSSNPSLFVFWHDSTVAFLLVYVDDIVLTGNNQTFLTSVVQLLDQQFTIKDFDNLYFFLRIEVNSFQQGLLLTQTSYIYSIMDRANMLGAKPINTPMATGAPLSKFTGEAFEDPSLYRSIVGVLQYATITRPILFVNRVSQFMHVPSSDHWGVVKRILCYLKGTLHHGLYLQSSDNLTIHAFANLNWAGCPDDRKSTTGYLVFYGNNLISWCSKKQSTVACSSTEAEYRGLVMVTAEVVWLKSLILELGFDVSSSILRCDNMGATFLFARKSSWLMCLQSCFLLHDSKVQA
jgi:Reverse transcriptase (RNA-dependent DNA polymerase)